jgi:hypothetical protein
MARPPLSARPPTDPAEERTLRRLASARHAPASLIQRARIITGSWDGASVPELAQQLGCHPKTVSKWLHRFNAHGLDGLADLPRPGPAPAYQRAPAWPDHRPGPLSAARPAGAGRRGTPGAHPAQGAGAPDPGRPGRARPGRGHPGRPRPGPPDPPSRAGALATDPLVDTSTDPTSPQQAKVIALSTTRPRRRR